jgi:hypothetical protein
MQIVRVQDSSRRRGSGERLIAVGGYVMLLLLGALEGLIGSFQYSRALGSAPAAAVAFAVLIGVTCVLGAWGTHRPLGGFMPAVGWLLTSFLLSSSTSGGSVLITNTAAGKWFLFGGTICAAAGVVTGFVRWSPKRPELARPGERPRLGLGPARPGERPRLGLGPARRRTAAPSAPKPGEPELGEPGADARKPDR